MRPTVAEIRLRSLLHNYRLLESNVRQGAGPAAGLVAVIKANAYGHGVAACGRALAEAGAPWLGVTSVDEAMALRRALGRSRPEILVMSGFFPGEEGAVLEHRLTPQVWEVWHLSLLDAAARRRGLGPGSVPVHLELDSGMSRQGVAPGEKLEELLTAAGFGERDSPVAMDGVLTHFSSPEELEKSATTLEMERFAEGIDQLLAKGYRPNFIHAGNSSNSSMFRQLSNLSRLAARAGATPLVRPGLSLYGVPVRFCPQPPAEELGRVAAELEPVLRWRTEITSLREVGPGTPVGYNGTFHATAWARLALLPVGYADGLNRLLSNRGSVLVRGRKAPIVGRISMDQTVVDVSSVPGAALGDEVVLLGAQGGVVIPVEEHADLCGTIPYEVLCGISARVPRVVV